MSTSIADLITVRELMKIMGISRNTVYDYMKAGMPSRWWSGRRFDLAAVREWAEKNPNFLKARKVNNAQTQKAASV